MVLIRFASTRILLLVTALNIVVLVIAITGWYGVVLTTRDADALVDASERDKLVKTYNFWSGLVMACISKPAEIVLTMLLAIATVAILSQSAIAVAATWSPHMHLVLMGANVGLVLLVTSGLSSLNVQQRVVECNLQFVETDLFELSPVSGNVHTPFSGVARHSFALENSILRTAFVGTQTVGAATSNCSTAGTMYEPPLVAFGFRVSPWMREMLSDSVTVTRTPLDVNELANGTHADGSLEARIVTQMKKGDDFLVTKGSSAQRLQFNLSDHVSFEAVVWDLPSVLNVSDATDKNSALFKTAKCGRTTCLAPIEATNPAIQAVDGNVDDNKRVFRKPWLWIPKNGVNRSSLIVSAVGSRITGDRMRISSSPLFSSTLSKATKHFTLLLGRLTWRTTNLAEKFNAACAVGVDCTGLAFPLQRNGSKVLVLGNKELGRLSDTLHLVNYQSQNKLDVIFPDNIKHSNLSISGDKCNNNADTYAKFVEVNHLYMEDPVHTSYTAALFYLFQNAALKETMTVLTTTSNRQSTLKLHGNKRLVEIYAVMPPWSASLSITGCVVILLAVLYSLLVHRRSSEPSNGCSLDQATVARTLLRSENYAKHLVKCKVEGNESFVSLGEFRVHELQLAHERAGSVKLRTESRDNGEPSQDSSPADVA